MADDTSTGGRTGASPKADLRPSRRRKGADVGISSESMCADMLGLERFSRAPKIFKSSQKGPAERLLNPFGDPWRDRKACNRSISLMTSSLSALLKDRRPEVASVLDGFSGPSYPETEAYRRYSHAAASAYHYDETVARIAPDMSAFAKMRQDFEKLNLRKKFIGYAIINFDEHNLYTPGDEPPEWAYLHQPEFSRQRADRVRFKDASTLDASGDVFDIRKPEVCSLLAKSLARMMTVNNVDAVLVDYAMRAYPFGVPALLGSLSADWLENFQESQLELIKVVHAELRSAGKELFLNGVMLDGIITTDPSLVKMFGRYCDGLFWEQPFRYEWLEFNHDGVDYYQRLDQFFDAIYAMKKKVIVKQGTYRFHASEDVEKSWVLRFAYTDHGIERHLATYLTCFYLLYADDRRATMLYTHPVEIMDIFASEAYFRFWDTDFGAPTHRRVELTKDVHMRVYENGIVFVNSQLKPVRISSRMRPAGYKGRIPRLKLEALSGRFWAFPVKRSIVLAGRIIRPRTRLQRLAQILGLRRKDAPRIHQAAQVPEPGVESNNAASISRNSSDEEKRSADLTARKEARERAV